MNEISNQLLDNKFKVLQQDKNYVLMKKRRYGNYAVHMFCLFIGLFFFWPLLIVNIVYFSYSYLWASPHVLLTTENADLEGKPLEFNTLDEVLDKANAVL